MTSINNKNKGVSTMVYALGGLHEVGKNMYVVEHGEEIIIMDAGVKFGGDMPGVDAIIQDVSHLVENKHKIKALVITHGHEDHIGAIHHLLRQVQVPVIHAPRIAVGLIRKKFKEHKVTGGNLQEFNSDTIIKTDNFTVSFFATTHSIPDTFGVAIDTPNGLVVNTGDFKFDLTPVGDEAEIDKMAALGARGIKLLLTDSTNSEVEGHSTSESVVEEEILEIFRVTKGRMIIATFASNVNRVSHIIKNAQKFGRKIAVFGRSMDKVVEMARQTGHIKAPDNIFVKGKEIKSIPDSELLIVCTGSQGEPLAALSRISRGEHRDITAKKGDTIVFSSSPIPGNALPINNVINNLVKTGATVVVNSSEKQIHASGHGTKLEQQFMLALMRPEYLMPVHGEYRMLKIHGQTGVDMGVDPDKVFLCSNGDVVDIHPDGTCTQTRRVEAGAVYLDQTHKGVSNKVMADRVILADDGFITVLVAMDSANNKLLARPQIISRGFVYMKNSVALLREMQRIAEKSIKKEFEGPTSFANIKKAIIKDLSPFIYRKLRRNPIIAPVLMNKNS